MKSAGSLSGSVFPNVIAGLISGLVTLVYSLSFAALVFSGKLAPYFPQGLGTALIGATVTAIIVAWKSPFPFTLAGPEANSAIILALGGRSIAAALSSPDQEASIYPTVWAGIILSTLMNGLLLYLLGRFRLGQLARYVPYPVIGGFLAGTGWLILRSSFKVMTGIPLGFAELPSLMHGEIVYQWIAGIAVAVVLFFVLSRFKQFFVMPGMLIAGIVVGNVGAWMLKRWTNVNLEGWFFEAFSQQGVWQAWNFSTLAQIDWGVLSHQGGTLLAMLVIVMLSILLNSTGLELATGRNVDLNDELRADGISNLVNGLCGGMIGYLSINRCLLNQRAGANSSQAGMIAGAFCGCVLFFGSSFLSNVPKPLLGGLLLYMGANLMMRWAYKTRFQLPRFDYLLVLFILVIIVTLGFIPGIGSGILIACILFIVSYGKTSSIKYSVSGKIYHSNVFRFGPQQQVLQQEGESIAVLVLHGFVFFGTANDLLDGLRRRLAKAERKKLAYVVFDFRLVTGLDSSAVLSFLKLAQLAEQEDLNLVFSQVNPVIEAQLRKGGLSSTGAFRFFANLDHGVEWCENQILQEQRMLEITAVPLASQLQDLLKNSEFVSELMRFLQRIDFAEGQYLCQQGDAPDGLYFLESGRVSVIAELANGTKLRRRTYTGGTILGEMGFFSGAPRSASVIADSASRLHYLSKQAFEKIEANAPLLAACFNKGIVNLVAERLRRSEEEVKMLLQ